MSPRFLLTLLTMLLLVPGAIYGDAFRERRMKAFPSQTSLEPWNVVLKGHIVSFSAMDEFHKKDMIGRAQDKSKVTVRLYSNKGVRAGDTLYVVDQYNLVVAKIKVKVVFNSTSFGPMMVGYGNFRQAGLRYRVVQRAEEFEAKDGYIYRARGDYCLSIGDRGKAIEFYKKAIEIDSRNPEAHMALGKIYYNERSYRFAYHELYRAYENRGRLYDNDDRYQLLTLLAELIYHEVYENSYLNRKMKKKLINQGRSFGREALKLKKDSVKALYYMGHFYKKGPGFDHVKAKDYFMKLLTYQPDNIDALIELADLYFLHDNKKKAIQYVDKALELNPGSYRAKVMKKKILRYNQRSLPLEGRR
jgi:predicted Zn-dependent protease